MAIEQTPTERLAWECVYQAWEAGSQEEANGFFQDALRLDPDNVEARLWAARSVGERDETKALSMLRDTVTLAERQIGPEAFEELRGEFWGFVETRPYMRARVELARLLVDLCEEQEAIGHFQELLELNPDDNQGLRYELLPLFLFLRRAADARALLSRYPDEASAFFAWGRVLERYQAAGPEAAAAALPAARSENGLAEDYLSERLEIPTELPGYYSPGDENEAILCAELFGLAWLATPGAIEWLRSVGPRP